MKSNHPASYKGVEIYQSSFDDGGSSVRLQALPMAVGAQPFKVEGTIGGTSQLIKGAGSDTLTLELTSLRTINVENFANGSNPASGVDVRKVDLRQSIDARLGAANKKTVTQKELCNVGPSVATSCAMPLARPVSSTTYMLPIDMERRRRPAMFLRGCAIARLRPFRYLRVPAGAQGNLEGFMRLRAALNDPASRERAVRRYVVQAVDPARTELSEQLSQSATRALALFAGSVGDDGKYQGGLPAVSAFMEANVPEAERSRAGEVLVQYPQWHAV